MDQPTVAQELIFVMAAVVAVMEEKAAAVVGAAETSFLPSTTSIGRKNKWKVWISQGFHDWTHKSPC